MNAADSSAQSAEPERRQPWQPLTFGGTARFSEARLGRLLLMELIVGAFVALAVVWFLQTNYAPVIAEAAQKMPDGAKIQDGRLAGVPETLLSETRLIAIAVTPDESTEIGQSADAQIQLRQTNFRIGCVFSPDWGMEFSYGPQAVDLSRSAVEPQWGAWHPVLFAGCGLGVVALLYASWALLALLYMAPAKFMAWFGDRKLTWGGAWKMCSAALMPGALLVVAAIVLYGREVVDLIGLACFYAGHFALGWIYVAASIPSLERAAPPAAKNPFAAIS